MEQVKVGFIPLTDSAPLVVAKEEGFFEQEELEVSLVREASWASIRDKLIFKELDAAHMLAPMLVSTTLGLSGVKKPLQTAYSFGLNGNAVSVSNELYDALHELEPNLVLKPEKSASVLKRVIEQRAQQGLPKLTFAVVFPYSMHHYLLRYWLRSAGIDVNHQIEIVVLPPVHVVQALEERVIDAYCVGEPWNTHAVKKQVGVTLITGCEILDRAPEKVLAVTQEWAGQNSEKHEKLVRALYRASAWIDNEGNRDQLIDYLQRPDYVGAPRSSIENVFKGQVCNPRCDSCRNVPDFSIPFENGANRPDPEHFDWVVEQMSVSGHLSDVVSAKSLGQTVYQTELFDRVVRELN